MDDLAEGIVCLAENCLKARKARDEARAQRDAAIREVMRMCRYAGASVPPEYIKKFCSFQTACDEHKKLFDQLEGKV